MPELAAISPQTQTVPAAVLNEVTPFQGTDTLHENSLQPFSIQCKLTVGAPDDPYEKEADAVADSVMRMPEQNFVQRKCAHCEDKEKVQRKPLPASITPFIQTKSENGAAVSEGVAGSIHSSRGSGSSLDSGTQSFMTSRMGSDFSNVTIHNDSQSAQLSQNLSAKAFTVGNDIYFNSGQYQPQSSEGKRLLAHELTHVVQQSGSSVKMKPLQEDVSGKINPGRAQNVIRRKLQQTHSVQLELNSAPQNEIQPDILQHKNVTGLQSTSAALPDDHNVVPVTTVIRMIHRKEDLGIESNSSNSATLLRPLPVKQYVQSERNLGVNFIQRKCSDSESKENIQRKELPLNFITVNRLSKNEQPGVIPVPSKSQQQIQRNVFGDAWDATGGRAVDAVGSAASTAVDAVGSAASTVYDAAGNAVSGAVEWVEDQAESIINRIAPGLIDFLRGDIIQNIKDSLANAVDAATGGLFSRLQAEGLQGVLEEFVSSLIDTVSGGVEKGCQAFAVLAQKILDFIRMLGGSALQRIRAFFQRVGGLLSSFWNNFALPVWDAIRSVAGSVWTWITNTATWLWELVRPIRETIVRAWNWLMRQFGIAWSAAGSALDWIKAKAEQAWNWLMQAIEPIKTPLMIIGGVLLMLSPLGPIVAVGAGAYAIYRGVQWVRANWNSEVFIRFRRYLKENILDVITEGIESLKNAVVGAFGWLANTLLSLQTPIMSLLESIGAIAVFRVIQSGIRRLANTITHAVNWAGTRLAEIGHHVTNLARDVWEFLRPYLEIVAKITFLAINPWLIPIVLSAWAWRILPDCFKPPIINFVLQIMISVLRNMPDFKLFGDTWPQIKQQIIQFLQTTLAAEQEEKIAAANRVARMVSELDLELISNQIQAARQMPGQFEGQMEEELLGADLTTALPFERTVEPTLSQQVASSGGVNQISPEDMALFQKSTYTESDIGVDEVGHFEPGPELIQSFIQRGGGEGSEVEFGNSTDNTRTVHSILSGMLPQDGAAGATGIADASAATPGFDSTGTASATPVGPQLSHEEETEQRLQEMMAQNGQNMLTQACNASQEHARGQTETPEAFPESAKFGPLTRGQRARYTLNQMYTGLRRWFSCNSSWLIPTIIGAIVVLVVAEVLTGGAVTAALPVIMEALTAIMLGVAVVRGAFYLGEYVYKSIAGDIAGAAKALARSIAVAAVEAIFALLGSSAFWKSLKSGAASVGRVVAGAGRAIGRAVPALGRAGRAVLSSIHAVIEQGRLLMRGVGQRVGSGVRTLDEFAGRLFARIRFRRFRIRFERGWFRLEGYINPWVLLATGRVVEVDEAAINALKTGGNNTVLGRTIRVGGVEGLVIGAERNASRLTQVLQGGERTGGRALEQNAALFEDIAGRGLQGSTAVYGAAVQNIIQHSSAAQALLRSGMSPTRLESIIQNTLRYAGADASTVLSRLQRIQRYNVQTFDRLLAELSHPHANRFAGGEWALEYLSRQSSTFIAGIEGFEIVGAGRRMDVVINGIGYEFKNWGDLRNVSRLVRQMAVDFQAGSGLSRFRYIFSPRAGETSGIIAAITAQLPNHFTPQQINLLTSQLSSIILR